MGAVAERMSSVEPEAIAVAGRIVEARTRRGWTQQQFAHEASVSVSTVQRWEKGDIPPHLRLVRLASILGVQPEEITGVGDKQVDQLAEIRRELAEIKAMLKQLL